MLAAADGLVGRRSCTCWAPRRPAAVRQPDHEQAQASRADPVADARSPGRPGRPAGRDGSDPLPLPTGCRRQQPALPPGAAAWHAGTPGAVPTPSRAGPIVPTPAAHGHSGDRPGRTPRSRPFTRARPSPGGRPLCERTPMPRIPVHTVDSAFEGSRDTLKALQGKFGKVLNIHGAMAHSPAVLQTCAAMYEALRDTGTCDAETREAIALPVGNIDDCSYCQAAHTAGGKAAGLSEQEPVDIRRGQVADPKLGALSRWSASRRARSAPSRTAPGRRRWTPAGPTPSSPGAPRRSRSTCSPTTSTTWCDRPRPGGRSGPVMLGRWSRAGRPAVRPAAARPTAGALTKARPSTAPARAATAPGCAGSSTAPASATPRSTPNPTPTPPRSSWGSTAGTGPCPRSCCATSCCALRPCRRSPSRRWPRSGLCSGTV